MLVIFCGKSGSGKDAIVGGLMEKGGYDRLVSCTSRPMREGEVEGREYYFVTEAEFKKMIKTSNLVEWRAYDTLVDGIPDTWYYGTKSFEPNDGITLCIKDIEGAKALSDYCKAVGEKCLCFYVDCPDVIREERARKRGSFNETEWNRRLKADAEDFDPYKTTALCDVTLVNVGVTKEQLINRAASIINICKDSAKISNLGIAHDYSEDKDEEELGR